MLLDLTSLARDRGLCDLFGVPLAVLPQVRRSDASFGTTAARSGLPPGLPISAVLGDSHAALYASGCRTPGTAKVTYGTGSSLMAPLSDGAFRHPALATTLAWWTEEPAYAVEANIIAAGAALDTAAGMLGFDGVCGLAAAAAASREDSVLFVPAFGGLGAPYWDRGATGLLSGLRRDTRREDLARAAFLGVAHQVADVSDAVRAAGLHLVGLRCDGAPSTNELLMGLQADLAGLPLRVSAEADLSALGVAELAARADGCPPWRRERHGPPRAPRLTGPARRRMREAWRQALGRSRGIDVRGAHDEED
jgi:glycerol kinase